MTACSSCLWRTCKDRRQAHWLGGR